MMMRSILKLRPALVRIKADASKTGSAWNSDPKLRDAIPEFEEFEEIAAIVPVLSQVEAMSEALSSDTNITLPFIVPKIFNLHASLSNMKSKSSNPKTKAFASKMIQILDRRFPSFGTQRGGS